MSNSTMLANGKILVMLGLFLFIKNIALGVIVTSALSKYRTSLFVSLIFILGVGMFL